MGSRACVCLWVLLRVVSVCGVWRPRVAVVVRGGGTWHARQWGASVAGVEVKGLFAVAEAVVLVWLARVGVVLLGDCQGWLRPSEPGFWAFAFVVCAVVSAARAAAVRSKAGGEAGHVDAGVSMWRCVCRER